MLNRRRAGAEPMMGRRYAFRALLSLLAGAVVFAIAPRANAYAWMIKHGYSNCAACHADPSGGELLTVYGRAMSAEFLSMEWGKGSGDSAERDLRRVARALARAAAAKSADPKVKSKAAEEEIDLAEDVDEEGGTGQAKAGKAKPEAKAEAKAAAEESAAGGEGEDAGEEAAAPEGEAAADADESAGAGSGEDDASGGGESEESSFADPFFGLLPASDTFLLGGSVRLASIYKNTDEESFSAFPMQLDVYGQLRIGSSLRVAGSIGLSNVKPGSPHARAAHVTTGEGGMNLLSRTHWIGYDLGGGQHTLRAGRLQLPFGVRIPEHVMWVREATQTDRDSDQQHGLALAMNFETARFELMGILGNYQVSPDEFRERGYSGFFEYMVHPKAAVGVSSLFTTAKNDRLDPRGVSTTRQAHGVFLRTGPGEDVSVLTELNLLLRSGREMGYVGFAQVDYELIQGLHALITGELLEMGLPTDAEARLLRATEGVGQPKFGGWLSVQWFFLPHFDMRTDVIVREAEPFQVLSQLHVYL